jgi:hypothetical protein
VLAVFLVPVGSKKGREGRERERERERDLLQRDQLFRGLLDIFKMVSQPCDLEHYPSTTDNGQSSPNSNVR